MSLPIAVPQPVDVAPSLFRALGRLTAGGLVLFALKQVLDAATSPAATHLLLLGLLGALAVATLGVALRAYRSAWLEAGPAEAQMSVSSADGPGLEVSLRRPMVAPYRDILIGRGNEAGVRLSHESASEKHARLRLYRNGAITLADLGSRNGTFLDGRRLDTHEVADVDEDSRVGFGRRLSARLSTAAHTNQTRHGTRQTAPAEWLLFAVASAVGLLFLLLHLQTAGLAGFGSAGPITVGRRAFDLTPHFDLATLLSHFALLLGLFTLLIWLKQRALPGSSAVVLPAVAGLTFVGHFQAASLAPRLFAKAAAAVASVESAGGVASTELLGRLDLLHAAGRQRVVVIAALVCAAVILIAYRHAFRPFAAVTSFLGGWLLIHWVALAGLVLLTLAIGTDLGTGKRLWLRMGPMTVQTIDLCKMLLIAGMASFFHFHLPLMESHPRRRRALLAACAALAILTVAVQRDMGGVVFLGAFAGLFYGFVTGEVRRVGMAFSMMALLGVLVYALLPNWSYASIVRTRVDKALDPQRQDEQLTLATIAVANGGLTGVGWGLGDAARAVPAIQSDFNMVALAEELGFVGAVSIVGLYLALALALWRLNGPRNNLFLQLFPKGVALSLMLQVAVIVGGDLSLIPLTGVTLPFISMGGTSYALTLVAVVAALVCDGSRWEENNVSWS